MTKKSELQMYILKRSHSLYYCNKQKQIVIVNYMKPVPTAINTHSSLEVEEKRAYPLSSHSRFECRQYRYVQQDVVNFSFKCV
ncbi:hypothetical protein FGO68_gene15675 [Halteria grandinella]|uniref:Uncharacterized protein n=1 Tax=Halteria grandinella TaxID=5974 RepID=A0A8J8NZS5_HALGN|nr:hypothetical protein FGO68_gene15675 [Halteria grandinella]